MGNCTLHFKDNSPFVPATKRFASYGGFESAKARSA